MQTAKEIVIITDDDFADYLPWDYAEALVKGPAIGDEGVNRDAKVVTRLMAWVGMQSGLSPEVRYKLSRHDAALILELAAR